MKSRQTGQSIGLFGNSNSKTSDSLEIQVRKYRLDWNFKCENIGWIGDSNADISVSFGLFTEQNRKDIFNTNVLGEKRQVN